jgi:hypothetical protein
LNTNNENNNVFLVIKIMKNNESENHEKIMKNNENNAKLEKYNEK